MLLVGGRCYNIVTARDTINQAFTEFKWKEKIP